MHASRKVVLDMDVYEPHGTILSPELLNAIRRKYVGMIAGHHVFAVDGAIVRDHVYPDFVAGGSESRYRFNPPGELWVEEVLTPPDFSAVLLHARKRSPLMHASVLAWVETTIDRLALRDARVLDVGSRDINGSCRSLFRGPYVGLDRVAGPNVDVVASACSIPFPDASCDVVISTEMLEHDDMFWHSAYEMGRVLRDGGYLLITARGNGFPLHHEGEMGDFYRFLPQGMKTILQLAGCEVLSVEEDPEVPGLFGLGRRLS